MVEDNQRVIAPLSFALLVMAGAILIAVAYIVKNNEAAFPVLLSVGAALEAAAIVAIVNRLIPPRPQRNKMLRGHAEIYNEFSKMLRMLDPKKPHVIRTINSFPPEVVTEKPWDARVTGFLKENPQTQFIRVVLYQETEDWDKRLKRIRKRYSNVPNYHQHSHQAPPTIEMFLVDKKEVLLSFATPELPTPSVTYGVRIRDPELCEQLETYHRIHLEQRIPRDDLS
ncbi:MAG: hypothetical protein ACE5KV_06160 [Thermoplasmata archaeon]